MRSSELVNLILDKLRTGRVQFVKITDDPLCEFVFGCSTYCAEVRRKLDLVVWRVLGNGKTAVDNYSRWVEVVLNGKTRNEDGDLVEVKSYE
jgi:hypothetical protein